MPFNVGDVVQVLNTRPARSRGNGRIQRVMPRRLMVQDFQEYVVEFVNAPDGRFRFGLCREFELRLDSTVGQSGTEQV